MVINPIWGDYGLVFLADLGKSELLAVLSVREKELKRQQSKSPGGRKSASSSSGNIKEISRLSV